MEYNGQAQQKVSVKGTVKGAPVSLSGTVKMGTPAAPGGDGFSPIANVERTESGAKITITDKKGTTEAVVYDGITPIKGEDYFTPEDMQQMAEEATDLVMEQVCRVLVTVNGETIETDTSSQRIHASWMNAEPIFCLVDLDGLPVMLSPFVVAENSAVFTQIAKLDRESDSNLIVLTIQGESATLETFPLSSDDDINKAVETALEAAKASGEFNGPKGDPGEDGVTPRFALIGVEGGTKVRITTGTAEQEFTVRNGTDGEDYVLTAADKSEIVAMVIESLGGNPVSGYVDDNNNIIVSGNLADGTYTVKYEMEDGTLMDIGSLVLGAVEPEGPAYVNQIPLSQEADGTPFNGGQGFKEGYRVNSSGVEEARTGSSVVGFIPFSINDTVYIKGISTTNNRYFVVYDGNHAKLYAWDINKITTLDGSMVSFDIKDKANEGLTVDQQNAIAYFRMCADSIDSNSIITINQPIE